MAGNVWEWTLSLWGKEWEEPGFKYPYDPDDGREDPKPLGPRVARGGAFITFGEGVRSAFRRLNDPRFHNWDLGFRVCVAGQQE